jgi:hypothetical protein
MVGLHVCANGMMLRTQTLPALDKNTLRPLATFLVKSRDIVKSVGTIKYLGWASVAQLAEQLICNQQVVGSSPSASLL